jgi:undecaprenol kinase
VFGGRGAAAAAGQNWIDMHSHKNQSFFKRLRFALEGLCEGIRAEHSLRFHAAASVCVVIALCIFRPEPIWWALAALACALVIMAELFNTAVEHLIDHLHPQAHPRIGIVKDLAAAAVLISVLGALGIAAAFIVHELKR